MSHVSLDKDLAIRDILTLGQRAQRGTLRRDPATWLKEFKELNIRPEI